MSIMTPLQVLAASLGDDALDVADVFSTDLYTGNSSTQTITNGLDMSGEGGLTWIKARNGGAQSHYLFDTARGALKVLSSDATSAEFSFANTLTSFNSDGFSLGSETATNFSSRLFASWSFRKAAKFFDIVTYTGDGTISRAISHNLGQTPGMVVVKCTSTTGNWGVVHRYDFTQLLQLDSTAAEQSASGTFPSAPTDTTFTVTGSYNTNSATYVAYLFAHDTSDSGIIQCGSFTGNGGTDGPTITLGWQPQFVLAKNTSGPAQDWFVFDAARDAVSSTSYLEPNTSAAEGTGIDIDFQSTGFKVISGPLDDSGVDHVYMAIRSEA